MMPKRIQRKRTKGWRKPAGAVIVTRGTKWGNPFVVGRKGKVMATDGTMIEVVPDTADEAVMLFERFTIPLLRPFIHELRGKDLCCWCKPGQACHASVLLQYANNVSSPQNTSHAI